VRKNRRSVNQCGVDHVSFVRSTVSVLERAIDTYNSVDRLLKAVSIAKKVLSPP